MRQGEPVGSPPMAKVPQLIHEGRAELAEGPVWHGDALWWVDINAGTLNRLDPSAGINTSRGTGGYLGAAVPSADGRWLLARQHDLSLLDWETGRFTPVASPAEGMSARLRFNDGKCDAAGRFWVGTKSLDQEEGAASLYALQPTTGIRRVLQGLSLSNGLAWSPDGGWFYHIDTPTRRVRRFTFDLSAGALGPGETLLQLGDQDGWPDGMTCDAEGHLWVALWSGRAVLRVDGLTGRVLERCELPVSNVSSCTFGGPDLRTLFITTAWEGMSETQRQAEPLAGGVFALRTDVPGQPVHLFRPTPGTPG